ncbi:hypothetical protein [Carboxylicivirga caseinilyticus]|uniref:hypothetical protein n=1 Tax=Carboxylicivirga caseinilyticus TaxID=3417572 RepID=UPI003D3464AB|nr:hypothetical protein [Marinilabiliaceae bacterium A049]
MRINEVNGIRGWIAFISSGTTLGLMAGIFFFNDLNKEISFDIILICGITGGALGWLMGYFYSRKTNMDTAYVPLYRSADIDHFYRRTHNKNLEARFLKAVDHFSDNELITAMAMRYYRLSDQSTNKLLNEIHTRSLSQKKVRQIYNAKKFYKDLSSEDCPCCECSEHVIIRNKKVSFCLVCGYNIKYDNPKSILNRLRWKMGFYSQGKLSLEDIEKMIFDK